MVWFGNVDPNQQPVQHQCLVKDVGWRHIVHLTGQRMSDYGFEFPPGVIPDQQVGYGNFAFESDVARNAAMVKWGFCRPSSTEEQRPAQEGRRGPEEGWQPGPAMLPQAQSRGDMTRSRPAPFISARSNIGPGLTLQLLYLELTTRHIPLGNPIQSAATNGSRELGGQPAVPHAEHSRRVESSADHEPQPASSSFRSAASRPDFATVVLRVDHTDRRVPSEHEPAAGNNSTFVSKVGTRVIHTGPTSMNCAILRSISSRGNSGLSALVMLSRSEPVRRAVPRRPRPARCDRDAEGETTPATAHGLRPNADTTGFDAHGSV